MARVNLDFDNALQIARGYTNPSNRKRHNQQEGMMGENTKELLELAAVALGLSGVVIGSSNNFLEDAARTSSFNVAVAGSLVMYDRLIKGLKP